MKWAETAIDLAAVMRASRSVGSRHVALRSRQIGEYSRTSSVVQSLNRRARYEGASAPEDHSLKSACETQGGEHDRPAAPTKPPVGGELHRTGVSHLGISLGLSNPAVSSLKHQTASSVRIASVSAPQKRPGPLPFSRSPGLVEEFAPENPETNLGSEEDQVPPGVNTNVFRTRHGSGLLSSLAKEKVKPTQDPHQIKQEAQYPAQWSGLASGAVKSHREHTHDKVAPSKQTEALPTENPGPITPGFDSTGEPTRRFEATPASSSTAGFMPEAKPTAEELKSVVDESAPNPLGSGKPYTLRESKVPATRLSRIWNYSGLAAGMLGGAISESVSRVVGGGGSGSVMLSGGNMERLVAKLSRMRGAALKLGQMLSFQDSKMLPGPIQEVMQRVQDRADYMPTYQRDQVLVSNLGESWRELFSEFEEKPIAAASIGQVHKAVLKASGKKVAVKIQFPGVADSINSDLDNLSILLTATKLLPKGLYLDKTIDNARTELGWECDYVREAECLARYRSLMKDETDVFLVPAVHAEASGKQVLTMDFMGGTAVTRVKSFTQNQRDWIGTQIMRLCLREITEFKFMQTDPNWTNFLYNGEVNKLELLDFGASREYPDNFITQYVSLLESASRADRETVKSLSEELGYLTGHESKLMLNAHIDSVITLAEPFLASGPAVYDFKDQTITERVKTLIPVMLKERLAPPPEETYSLHRKLSGAFLLCARLGSKVPCQALFKESLMKSGVKRGG